MSYKCINVSLLVLFILQKLPPVALILYNLKVLTTSLFVLFVKVFFYFLALPAGITAPTQSDLYFFQ